MLPAPIWNKSTFRFLKSTAMLVFQILEPALLILGLLVTCTFQVDIIMQSIPESVTCPNIQPGQCCLPLVRGHMAARIVRSSNLMVTDAAAIWKERRIGDQTDPIQGCSGAVIASRAGPGSWIWRYDESDIIYNWQRAQGASYITLPTRLPPQEGESKWLAGEGVLGLVWGGGKWFASPSASGYLQRTAGLPKRNQQRRGIISSQKGQVYAAPPPSIVFPTHISINGTNYTAEAVQSLIYRNDRTGEVLNLTTAYDQP